MSKFEQKNIYSEEKRLDKKENERSSRETLGKYYYDLSKLAFATSVVNVSEIFSSGNLNTDKVAGVVLGSILTVFFAILGYRTIKIEQL